MVPDPEVDMVKDLVGCSSI